MTDGSWTVAEDEAGVRLDKFLAAAARLASRGRAVTALGRGKVFRNGVEQARDDGAARVQAGDVIRVWMSRPGSSARRRPVQSGDLRILFEDDQIIVMDKPAGLLAVPLERRSESPSAVDLLEQHLRPRGKRRPLVVHRIDRDTSGVVLFAKDPGAQARLKDQFRRREPERVYWAVVYGRPEPRAGIWRDRLVWDQTALIQKETHPRDPKGADAISEYRVLEQFRDAALIEVRLRTGKRNQIRLQARLRGHTLVGEKRYVYGPDAMRTIPFKRQALHAFQLGFRHPVTGEALRFEAAVPADMQDLLKRLRAR